MADSLKAEHKENLKLAVHQHNEIIRLRQQAQQLRDSIMHIAEHGMSSAPQDVRTTVTHVRDEFKSIIEKVLSIEHIALMDEKALHHEFVHLRSLLSRSGGADPHNLVGALDHEQAVETIILTEEKQVEKLLRRALAYFLKYNKYRQHGRSDHSDTSLHMIIWILVKIDAKLTEAQRNSEKEIEELKSAILA